MSYPINKTNGDLLVTLDDGQLNTDTSVGLVGRNYVGYGEVQNENFLHLLENFASSGAPSKAITGQLWFNTSQKILSVYDASTKQWNPVGSAVVGQASPVTTNSGQLWFDSANNQLKVYTGTSWVVIGPESIANFGETKAKAAVLMDTTNTNRPVVMLVVNSKTVAIIATDTFRIKSDNSVLGFDSIVPGINISTTVEFTGTLNGTADYANRLTNPRQINGTLFDGGSNITITANTTNKLKKGNYLLGADFNGSAEVTLSVDGSTENTPNKVVVRDNNGNFAANEITATLKGQVNAPTGTSTFDNIQVNSITGTSIKGTADKASSLSPGAKINNVQFDGTANITIAADANTLTGTNLNATVVDSSLKTVGILQYLKVGDATTYVDIRKTDSIPTISTSTTSLKITAGSTGAALTFNGNKSIIPSADTNLGSDANKFNFIYATEFKGVATSAYYADLAENYVSDSQYEAGTVLEFGGDFEVTLAQNKTNRVAGVVSTDPAYLMNSHQSGEFVVAIALQGKVPCKVAGYVSKGDMLVSAGKGYAMASDNPLIGTVIGKSLEDFHGEYGVINIVVGKT